VFGAQRAVRVLHLDGRQRGGRKERGHGAMFGNHPPKLAGRILWPAFAKNRGAAVKQRCIDGVGVADRPAEIASRPPHLAGIDTVEVFHRPFQRDQVGAVVAHDALHSRRARDVEQVERIA
jgi:hypothetical protein